MALGRITVKRAEDLESVLALDLPEGTEVVLAGEDPEETGSGEGNAEHDYHTEWSDLSVEELVELEDLCDKADLADLQGAELNRFNNLHPRNSDGTFKTKGSGGSSGSGDSRGDGGTPTKETRERIREQYGRKDGIPPGKITQQLVKSLIADERLNPYVGLLRQAIKVAGATGNIANNFISQIPLALRGPAKDVVGRALEKFGFKVKWTTYEDGSKTATAVTERPKNLSDDDLGALEFAGEVSNASWNGDASRFTDDEYKRSCIADTGEGTPKSRYKLPVREPKGALNRSGLKAAYGALAGARGGVQLSEDVRKKAIGTLKRLFGTAGLQWSGDPGSKTVNASQDAGPLLAELTTDYGLSIAVDLAATGGIAAKMPDDWSEKYTKPELRWRLYRQVNASEVRGTAAGKWSLVKTLELNRRYKAQGGGFKGSRDSAQTEVKREAAKLSENRQDTAVSGSIADLSLPDRSSYTPDQWTRACIIHEDGTSRYDHHRPDEPIDTSKHRLPVRKPDGTVDDDALASAVREIFADSAPEAVRRRAARELVRAYKDVDQNPPDSLRGLAGLIGDLYNRYYDYSDAEADDSCLYLYELGEDPALVASALDFASSGVSSKTWKISSAMKSAAKWALELKKKAGETFGTAAGARTARFLIDNDTMDESWARRVWGYLARHHAQEGEKMSDRTTNSGKSAGLWGGMDAFAKLKSANFSALTWTPSGDVPLVEVGFELADSDSPGFLLPLTLSGGDGEGDVVELAGKKFKSFWKDLLPVGKKISYSGGGVKRTLDLSKAAMGKVVSNFKAKAANVPFVMVDEKNRHSDSPELARGMVTDVRIKGDHVQCLIEPRTKETESFLSNFPEFGISAKYHPDYTREADGKHFGPTIFHAAGTWRPHIPGMGLWSAVKKKAAALSQDVSDEVLGAFTFSDEREVLLDLTSAAFEEEIPKDSPKTSPKRGERMKVEFRDGKLVFLSDDGEELNLTAEQRKQAEAQFAVSEEGPTTAELATRLRESELGRVRDRNEARATRYIEDGVPADFMNHRVLPLANFAAEHEDAKASFVTLSQENGAPKENTHEVPIADLAWKMAEDYKGVLEKSGQLIKRGESGSSKTPEGSGSRDRQIADLADAHVAHEKTLGRDVSYAEAVVAVQADDYIPPATK